MATYRLDVEYEGTRYHGWQLQANARSVTGELRRAIERAGVRIVELGGAGRTDAGVHALAQTAHLRLDRAVDPEPLRRRINDALPADVHIRGVWRAQDGFHARHDAVARSYVYQISRRRTALAKRYVWWIKQPLDLEAIAAAAARLVGRHDFAALCERPADQASTIVVLERAEVAVAGDLVLLRLVASHFLWKMVRRVVGVLVKVGKGEVAADALDGLLDAAGNGPETAVAAWTAPPSGLFLERVIYPGEPGPGPLSPAVPVAAEGPAVGEPFLGAVTSPGAARGPGRPGRRRGASPRAARPRRPGSRRAG